MPQEENKEIRVELPPEEEYKELPVYDNLVRAIIITLLVIFALGNITCLALFVMNAFGITNLSDAGLGSLAGATIAEVAGLLMIVVKRLL